MLTRRQSELLAYIETYQRERGYSPSYREMAAAIGLHSTNGIHRTLHELQERGFVVCNPRAKRSIEIVRSANQTAREAVLERALRSIGSLRILQIAEQPDLPRRMAAGALEKMT